MSMIVSGLPMFHPVSNLGAGGKSLESPSGAPESAHAVMVASSSSLNRRSLLNLPCAGSASHGGIFLVSTAAFIAFAHGRTSLNEVNAIGAASPARWHSTQRLLRIFATSFV